MPLYDYECEQCGMIEISHRMSDTVESCPECNAKVTKCVTSCNFKAPEMWSAENNGRGHYVGQLADKQNDPNAYFKSKSDLVERCRKEGHTIHN